MSRDGVPVIDFVAQAIQNLHSDRRLRQERPLLRIDNLEDAAQAPFQFDAASGRLHLRSCKSISARSRLSLYGVWRIGPEESTLFCSRCKPIPMEKKSENHSDAADMLFGLVSFIDQFGSVLRERGHDYRKSEDGQQFSRQFEGMFQRLDRREQDFLSTLFTTMDGLIKTVRDIDDRFNNSNGEDKANGQDKHEADPAEEA